MTLTPNDIVTKEFNTKFRGYDQEEVNDFLDRVVARMEELITQNERLSQDLQIATEKNEYFAQLQESLNSSILVAQEAAERLKQNARKEAELILYEAEQEADRLIGEASDNARTIVIESDNLRRRSKDYRAQLEATIRRQLDVVTSEEYVALFDKELETSLNPEDFKEAGTRAAERAQVLEDAQADAFQSAKDMVDPTNQGVPQPQIEPEVDLDQTQVFQYNVDSDTLTQPKADTQPDLTYQPDLALDSNPMDSADMTAEPADEPIFTLGEDSPGESFDLKERSIDVPDESKVQTESFLGQTIRIDLPIDED